MNIPRRETTVLVIDDAVESLAILNELLRGQHRVLAANSGETGLRIAGGQPRPDLILLDVMMPGMDGYTVLARLREQATTRDIPVIFLTSLGGADDEGRGRRRGPWPGDGRGRLHHQARLAGGAAGAGQRAAGSQAGARLAA